MKKEKILNINPVYIISENNNILQKTNFKFLYIILFIEIFIIITICYYWFYNEFKFLFKYLFFNKVFDSIDTNIYNSYIYKINNLFNANIKCELNSKDNLYYIKKDDEILNDLQNNPITFDSLDNCNNIFII